MSLSDLTEQAKKSLIQIIELIQVGKIDEEFFIYGYRQIYLYSPRIDRGIKFKASKSALDALEKEGLITNTGESEDDGWFSWTKYKYQLNCQAYKAVKSNFDDLDTPFIKNTILLADASNLDNELKQRCLSILSAGSSDSTLWDSAVRTAGVILEERLRTKGEINDSNLTGRTLVNKIFTDNGILASKFDNDSKRQGYRELYAGIMGTFRNPSAHRLIDPTPEEGGAFIIFVDLLLKKLDSL